MSEINTDNLISFSEAARILGVSRPTIYSYIERDMLSPVAIGRNRYFEREKVETLLETLKAS